MRVLFAVGAVFVTAATPGVAAPATPAHRAPCHRAHACPSDHHTYPWRGLWCTSYADERQARDKIRVRYGGRTYWCHRR